MTPPGYSNAMVAVPVKPAGPGHSVVDVAKEVQHG